MSPQVAAPKRSSKEAPTTESAASVTVRKRPWTAALERFGLLIVLVILVVAFTIALPGQFFTSTNLKITLEGQAVILILAMAETIPLRAGDFDLSVAAVMVASASLIGVLTTQHHMAVIPAVLIALVGSVAFGAVNAIVVVGFGIDAFIATLGSMTWLGGVTAAFTHGNVISSLPQSLVNFSDSTWFGISRDVFYGWALVLILWYVYEYTPFGRRLLFTGGNRDAARLTGIRVKRMRSMSFILSALIAGMAGVILAGSVGAVDPTSAGSYLLQPFAAAFLGTTVIQFGRFNAIGTLVGLYLLAAGVSGLNLLGAQTWVSDVFNGGTLVIAVVFATQMRRGALSGKLRVGREVVGEPPTSVDAPPSGDLPPTSDPPPAGPASGEPKRFPDQGSQREEQ
jgi:ribose transport system permease protein